MKKQRLATLAAGSALAAAVFNPVHAAQGSPFQAQQLDQGYQLAQAGGKQPEAACGGKKPQASCGADKKASDKKNEAACGGKKPQASCGASK